ncbi:hypothetical protein SELMODRAFT_431994 [Selaginella moellendorffii]|uniref:Uncharacterized protein n=1 Tax=Selaginella moellendorffii TaxID=88036 RepID=D8TEM5_SELML|nr:hypothetical protein SELMODRAFT_431994 [Selaginella moellendorffii]
MGTALTGLNQLRVLDVGQNRLKGPSLWDALRNCPLLMSLVASRNRLTDLPTFAGSVLLRELWLNGNVIRKLSSVAWMPNLQRLYLQDNSIDTIEPLWGCPALEVLDLSFNSISDLTQLRQLACFIHLRSLQLNDNPVSEHVEYVDTVLNAVPWLIELDNEAVGESTKSEVVKTIFLNVMRVIGMQYLHEKAARNEIISSVCEKPDEIQMVVIKCTTQNQSYQWFQHPTAISAGHNQDLEQHTLPLDTFRNGSAYWIILRAAVLEALQYDSIRSTLAASGLEHVNEKGLCLSTDVRAKLDVLCSLQMCSKQREKLLLASKDFSAERDDYVNTRKNDLEICLEEHVSFQNTSWAALTRKNEATNAIQALWKGRTMQKKIALLNRHKTKESFIKLQALWRGYSFRKKLKGAIASSKYIDNDTFDYGLVDEEHFFVDDNQFGCSKDIIVGSASSGQLQDVDCLLRCLLNRSNRTESKLGDEPEIKNELAQIADEWGFKSATTIKQFMKACRKIHKNDYCYLKSMQEFQVKEKDCQMNNNLLTERAIRDVFEVTSYITFGSEDAPLQYGLKAPLRSAITGKHMVTNPAKKGKTVDVYFQKEHPWVSDGDPYKDRMGYRELQPEKYKGFLSSDFTKRDEFSNTMRTNQYREMLEVDNKHSKKTLAAMTEQIAELADGKEEKRVPTRFEGPKYLYDIGKPGLAVTPHCSKCHHQTYYCQHRAAYCTNNLDIEKQKGGYQTASDEIGRHANSFGYTKPQFAHKPIIEDTFYRQKNIFFPAKTRTSFVQQANPVED